MDYQQVIQARQNRKTRLGRPYKNFIETFNQCVSAGDAILTGSIAPEIKPLIERSIVISTVSAIEVYYRDMLDYIFRYCSPDFFEPKLKQLHADKYDITDMLFFYKKNIHPLELVSSAQSFQSIERIDKVFSQFIGKGLWLSILELKVRSKDKPDKIVSWENTDLAGLKKTFELRHELVHNPALRPFLTEKIIKELWHSAHMIFGSDIILGGVLTKNKDSTLANETNI